ncbi:putative OPI3-methylene-fatty-acyl-phospholipid synthase [Meira miltonrushii]|uniref:Phosphatidyl-N-methylethanolamine N-methyltransferase n=1 Tax=Meira miltonrushii TaxID=1280837 RepID=A0A316VDG9_9BASI|nr:putative OPI3-methylene-fatty-acyl-phospholipid synthase [Meira miltonrushii]PWN35540.1 putative OPI3-methylene-fatty-acyl-phospholipid synthase [Meira miltonrushii]
MAILPIKTNPYYVPDLADFSQRSFWVAAVSIIFNPLFWNFTAQNEYRHKTITKLLGNRPYYGCYLLGASIFLLGILRDHLYNQALSKQPINGYLALPFVKYFGGLLILAGQVLVISSMYALGVTGTYLGDYFGILMPHIVTGFPFNVVSDPMYFGSSLSFIGVALWYAKPAGLILSVLLSIVYVVALKFESPFTAEIYKKAAASSSSKATTKKRTSNATSQTTTPAKRGRKKKTAA